ncbi:MAG: DUF1003 domain-containing protein [Flavobacteriales bacterium]|nr:DUF1003 domain-containing protein [Flavobacteriales bacterium]
MSKPTGVCHLTKQVLPLGELAQGYSLKPQLIALIKKDFPDFSSDSYISLEKLNEYRRKYLESLIKKEHRDLNKLEKEVLKAITDNELLSDNIEPDIDSKLTLGERVADNIAVFGGSWTFIISFFTFLTVWIIGNIWVLSVKPFDPFPFILLNLILSCLAAIQAPIIMMSQNRKEQKDRSRSEHDYKVNLKAELEIRLLHEKLDHMIVHQNKHLLDIQELQLDYLEELVKKNEDTKE